MLSLAAALDTGTGHPINMSGVFLGDSPCTVAARGPYSLSPHRNSAGRTRKAPTMSTVLYSAHELANVVSVLYVRVYNNRAALVKTMSEVATVNAFAYNTAYGENVPAVTAEEIDAEVRLSMASIDRAITTATMLCYNCDGFMNDRLRGDVGSICGDLARKAMEKATEMQERITRLNATVAEQSKEIAALKVKPARKPRAVKGDLAAR